MSVPLIVATGNPGKVKEFEHFFAQLETSTWDVRLKPADLDIEETGATFAENALLKARGVAEALNYWAIADDSGLSVTALDGAPGVYSARYAPTTEERNHKLLQELSGVDDRRAEFVCAITLCRPDGSVAAAVSGICPGVITTELTGDGGFGYDPLFYVPSSGKTFAEMTREEKQLIGHRGLALAQLRSRLESSDFT